MSPGGPPSANDELARLISSKRTEAAVPALAPPAPSTELSWPCLLMRMGTRWCGLRADAVREVVAPEAITRVPAQPGHVLGVSLVHGRLVPAIDLAPLMPGMDIALENPPGRRLAVIAYEEVEIGVVADEAKGVIYLPAITESQSADRPMFIIGEVYWEDQLVCLLDAPLLVRAAIGAV